MEISAKTLHFIEEHKEDDTRTLALQSKKYPDVDMAAAVTQIAGRQVAARKIPSWYPVSALWYPPHCLWSNVLPKQLLCIRPLCWKAILLPI